MQKPNEPIVSSGAKMHRLGWGRQSICSPHLSTSSISGSSPLVSASQLIMPYWVFGYGSLIWKPPWVAYMGVACSSH